MALNNLTKVQTLGIGSNIEVVGVRVNRDAPCSNNSGIFEIWPGDETHIYQWFV